MSDHQHYPNAYGTLVGDRVPCGICGYPMTVEEVRELRRALAAGEVADPTAGKLGLIGRDRYIVDRLTVMLREAANIRHGVKPIVEGRRGGTFDVAVNTADGEATGLVCRVTVELLAR